MAFDGHGPEIMAVLREIKNSKETARLLIELAKIARKG